MAENGDEVDLNFFTQQFELRGGNIMNVTLATAFLAAIDGGVVTMRHLFQATQHEYKKFGKILSDAEIHGYSKQMASREESDEFEVLKPRRKSHAT